MKIELPGEGRDAVVVASVSGGKDSAALVLALREAEISARYVFADTGWEHPATYAHLDTMRQRLGIQIDVVGVDGGMMARARTRAGFPLKMARWCTAELKIKPIRRYVDAVIDATGNDAVNAVGVRADESESRRKLPSFAFDKDFDGLIWRPLLNWTVEDVLAIHRRHGLPMNPLYAAGYDRVGCYPCIYSSKSEIARIAEDSPQVIDRIAEAEAEFTALRGERNAESPRRYATAKAAFFSARVAGDNGPASIYDVVDWARTGRGGRQRLIWDAAPRGGCMRWGLCETGPLDK